MPPSSPSSSVLSSSLPADQQRTSTLHSARSAERVLSLLETVANAGAMNLATAAAHVELPTSTALRHLRLLTNRGYLLKDEQGQYSLGPAFVRIALASQQRGPYARLTNAAQPRLERLVELTEESAYLAIRDGDDAVYIATTESHRAIRHVGWVGRAVPLEGTAVGEALLSAPQPNRSTPQVWVNTGAIEPDVTAVVAPVYGSQRVVGALSVLGPAARLSGKRLQSATRAVGDVALEVSLALAEPEVPQL